MDLGNTTFTVYWIALVVSGVLLLVTAGTGFGHQSKGIRILNAVIGLAFLGYGGYLALFFTGGHYLLVLKAFIVPIALLVNAIRGVGKKDAPAPAFYPPPPAAAPGPNSPHLAYLQGANQQPAGAQPGVPVRPTYPAQPGYPAQPQPGYAAQPQPGYSAQPQPGYAAQPQPGYPAQPGAGAPMPAQPTNFQSPIQPG
jgi:hypothetical protein